MTSNQTDATNEEWISAQFSEAGKPVLVRLQNVRLDSALEARFPHLVTIAVTYPADNPKGLPTAAQYALLGDYEDSLLDGLEARGDGVAAVVRTANGTMTFRVYVGDAATAVADFDASPCAFATTLTVIENDRWAAFRAARASIPDE